MDMNNVVQNIEVSMIIPPSENIMIDNNLQNLVDSIREYGILEPLLLKPQKGKYQIIIGNKRYEAARLLGLKAVPALIKNIDDEVVEQYKMINNYDKKKNTSLQEGKFINSSLSKRNIPNEQLQPIPNEQDSKIHQVNNFEPVIENSYQQINNRTKNSDIINLSELNKIEYERDDFNMNNNMSNMMNNNMGVSPQSTMPNNQEPTFGGRFFPSLEDEPTNMNMGSINPSLQNNNLIDLTDINTEQVQPSSNQQVASFNTTQPQNLSVRVNSTPLNTQFDISRQQEQLNPIPGPTDNVINIGTLQNENQMASPSMNQSTMQENSQVMMNQASIQDSNQMINNQIQTNEPSSFSQINPTSIYNNMPENNMVQAQPEQNIASESIVNVPQFDMSQNVAPTEYANPNSEVNVSTEVDSNLISGYSDNNQQGLNIPVYNQELEQPVIENNSTINLKPKDVTPVLNIIKNISLNLESFGYKINIYEEDLSNAVKITIEVEK